MKRVLTILACVTLLSTSVSAQQYFPKHTFYDDDKSDQGTVSWYSGQLKALEEPSLWELSQTSKQQTYRFLWLRTFHHPIAVRFEVQPDGSGILTVKVADGTGGYAPGKLIENRTKHFTKDQTKFFLKDVEDLKYWTLTAKEPRRISVDGAQWIIEATRNGQYKIVERWSPENGPIRTLGLELLIDLADLPLLYKEVY
jgi:hypothetical protein